MYVMSRYFHVDEDIWFIFCPEKCDKIGRALSVVLLHVAPFMHNVDYVVPPSQTYMELSIPHLFKFHIYVGIDKRWQIKSVFTLTGAMVAERMDCIGPYGLPLAQAPMWTLP